MTTLSIEQTRRTRSASSKRSILPYALWTAQVALALMFLFAGGMKLVMSSADLTKDIDLPVLFLRFIGVCEVLGAIALVAPGLPRMKRELTPLAAAGLVIIMIGAVVVTIVSMGVVAAVFPLVVGLVTAFVAYNRRSWFSES